MIGKALLMTQLSGSLAGITASHNRGGAYLRERASPTQPNTPEQLAVKGFFGDLAALWRDTLTQAQRDDWDLYGAATPLLNAIGDPFTPTGLNMYIRGNVPLLQAGDARIDAGPVTAGLPSVTPPSSASASASTNVVDVAFDNTDLWANQDTGHMNIYIARGQTTSINFFKGPYRLAGTIDGNSITPPTSPAAITSDFNLSDGQKAFCRAAVVDEEGRLSQEFFFEVAVTSG